MPDKYVPREVGEVYAAQWLPGDPEATRKMMGWIIEIGLMFSFEEEDSMVILELRAPKGTEFLNGKDFLQVYPGNYLVARDRFEVRSSYEFEKAFRKEFSDV